MTLKKVAALLIVLLDYIAIQSVAITGEMSRKFLLIVPALAVVAYLLSRQRQDPSKNLLPDQLYFGAFVFVVMGSTYAVWKNVFNLHPLVVVAHASLLIHGLIWFGKSDLRNRYMRVGMGFVDMVLAVALSPDIYLAISLFAFVVTASLVLSCSFLQSEYQSRAQKFIDKPLPKVFFTNAFWQSGVVLLMSIMIFPILPRPRVDSVLGGWASPPKTEANYTEKVELGDWRRWAGDGSGATVIRVFLPQGASEKILQEKISQWIPGRLLKGQVLDLFTEANWIASRRYLVPTYKHQSKKDHGIQLQFVREPIGSPVLPVPYNTILTHYSGMKTHGLAPIMFSAGEWVAPRTESRRANYLVHLGKMDPSVWDQLNSEPDGRALMLPKVFKESTKWNSLVNELVNESDTPRQKVSKIFRHLKYGKFLPHYGEPNEIQLQLERNSAGLSKSERARNVLSDFLFVSRQGHCELFASSAAILMRLAGVPSRLVSGFRISGQPIDGILNVKQGDAHAWVEAYDPQAGWFAVDPTPVVMISGPSWTNYFTSLQDQFSSLWYRYVVSYDGDEQRALGRRSWRSARDQFRELRDEIRDRFDLDWSRPMWILAGLVLLVIGFFALRAIFIGLVRLIHRSQAAEAYDFSRVRSRDLLRRIRQFESLEPDGLANSELVREFWSVVDRLRYGPLDHRSSEWNQSIQTLDRIILASHHSQESSRPDQQESA